MLLGACSPACLFVRETINYLIAFDTNAPHLQYISSTGWQCGRIVLVVVVVGCIVYRYLSAAVLLDLVAPTSSEPDRIDGGRQIDYHQQQQLQLGGGGPLLAAEAAASVA